MSIQREVNLKKYNSFGIEAKAALFAAFAAIDEATTLLKDIKKQNLPLLILGGGSNILLTRDFDGMVLKNEIKGITVVKENEEHVWVKVGAGENWHQFVLHALDQNWAGIENLSLIPGTVGAAPMQNIGAYGVEIKETFDSLRALNLSTLKMEEFKNADCKFGYRESIFKNTHKGQYLITDVSFRLNKKANINSSYGAISEVLTEKGINNPTIRDIADAVIQIRRSKLPDPAVIGNAGSFFKNPVIDNAHFERLKQQYQDIPSYAIADNEIKIPAGWLIEKAGWKGKKLGNYGVHDKQALVLVNHGGASGNDLKKMATDIQQSVANQFEIQLQAEVNFI